MESVHDHRITQSFSWNPGYRRFDFLAGRQAVSIVTTDDSISVTDPFASSCGRFPVDPTEAWGLTPEMVRAWWERILELDMAGDWDGALAHVDIEACPNEIDKWLHKHGLRVLR